MTTAGTSLNQLSTNNVGTYQTISSIYPSNSTISNSIYTTQDIWSNFYNNDFGKIVDYLKEEDIKELLDKVRGHATPEDFREIVLSVILRRHVSEDFILTYLEDPIKSKGEILGKYKAEIRSGEYASLALLLELND